MKALLVGGTGLTGGFVLNNLLENSSFTKVNLLSRRSLYREHEKLEEFLVDFSLLNPSSIAFKVDVVFCCLGTTIDKAGSKENFRLVDFEYITQVARIAKLNGVKQFVLLSSVGADSKSAIFYLQVKGETEDFIKRLAFNSLHIFRPSLLLGERRENRWKEKIGSTLNAALGFALTGGLKKYRGIEASTVAKAMVHVSTQNLIGQFIYEADIDKLAKQYLPDKKLNLE